MHCDTEESGISSWHAYSSRVAGEAYENGDFNLKLLMSHLHVISISEEPGHSLVTCDVGRGNLATSNIACRGSESGAVNRTRNALRTGESTTAGLSKNLRAAAGPRAESQASDKAGSKDRFAVLVTVEYGSAAAAAGAPEMRVPDAEVRLRKRAPKHDNASIARVESEADISS